MNLMPIVMVNPRIVFRRACLLLSVTKPNRKSGAKPAFSTASPAVKILCRPQHQDTLNPLSVEMFEMSGVAGQQIVGLPVNRGQQDRLVLPVEPDRIRI